jgi:hypothetical protein
MQKLAVDDAKIQELKNAKNINFVDLIDNHATDNAATVIS